MTPGNDLAASTSWMPQLPNDLTALEPVTVEQLQTRLQAVRDRPTDAEAYARLGMVFEIHEYRSQALRCYARAAALDPSTARWRYHWAVLALRLGDSDGAERALREVVSKVPDFAPAHEWLGKVLLERNAYEEAASCFETVMRLRPREASGYVHAARTRLAMGQYQVALELAQQALSVSPVNAEAHYLLGRAYQGLGRTTEAGVEFARGSSATDESVRDPWRADVVRARLTQSAQHGRAVESMGRGELAEAARQLESVLKHKPTDINVLNNLAITYLRMKRINQAGRLLERALKQMPDNALTHVNLSVVRLAKGDLPGALEHADRAIHLSPGGGRAYVSRGSVLARMGRYEEALASFRKATRLDARNPDVYLGLGEMLARLERWDEAASAFEEAATLKPGSVQAWFNLGIALGNAGRFNDGVHALQTASRLDPKNQRVKRALDRAERFLGRH